LVRLLFLTVHAQHFAVAKQWIEDAFVMCSFVMSKITMFRIATPAAYIVLVAIAALPLGATSLHAQGPNIPAEPNPVFVPQAEPGQAKKAPVRRAAPKPAAQQSPPQSMAPGAVVGLPNGATAISETYGDWTLNCGADKGAKFCTLSQTQVNKEGQRAFAFELRMAKDGSGEGTILMPFGLKLDAGVVLKLDDQSIGEGLRFSTCMAQGCLLPVSFPSAGMEAIRHAKSFTVGALNVSNNQLLTIGISLNGFAVALDRAVQVVS
jgi:invasion protein IalB